MKTETSFIFIRILIIIICAIIAIKIENIIWEFIPHTNFFGESDINRIPGLVSGLLDSIFGTRGSITHTYNEGDIFQRIFGIAIWFNLVLITTFIINLFKKDFMKSFLKPFDLTGNIKKDGSVPWFVLSIIYPIGLCIIAFLIDTIFYFIF